MEKKGQEVEKIHMVISITKYETKVVSKSERIKKS